MKKVQIAFYILTIIFIILMLPTSVSAYQILAGDAADAFVGVLGLGLMALPVIVIGSLVYLTKDYEQCP